MMRNWMLALLCLPFFAGAQDFTREGTDGNSYDDGNSVEMLVLPYHPHYHISEVDRMMCPPTMDVNTFREKIRTSVARELTIAFSDSLEVIDLSVQVYEEEIDIKEYMYNAMDFQYEELTMEEEKKKRFDIGLPKRKEEKVYGAKSRKKDGQLYREEIMHDRFMMANIVNQGAAEYLHDLYAFDHLLVITQIEITRDLEAMAKDSYVCSLHLALLDSKGNPRHGYKEVMKLTAQQLEYSVFKNEVLPAIANGAMKQFWPKMYSQIETSSDNADY